MAVNVMDYGAVGDGVTDDTQAFADAFLAGNAVYAPEGMYLIDPDVGIVVPNFGHLYGDGIGNTVFKADTKGATLNELATYQKGSLIKREFTDGVANPYCSMWHLHDFSVVLNHPTFNANNYRQIGVDLRNVTRSVVERVSVTNKTLPTVPYGNIDDMIQGYCFVLGTSGSQTANPDYCGGEGNVLRNVYAWRAYKGIAIDDPTLSGVQSAAHGTIVDNADISNCHELILQGSQYTAGCHLYNLMLQACKRQTGNNDPTFCIKVGGYNNRVHARYIEAGHTECDHFVVMLSNSAGNYVQLDKFSGGGDIVDNGTNNEINGESAEPQLTLIPQNEGTVIGNMTDSGGNAAAFDGNTNKLRANCARKAGQNNGYVGKQWSAPRTIAGYDVYGSSDYGFDGTTTGHPNITHELKGSDDGTNWTTLHTSGSFVDTDNTNLKEYRDGINVSTAYEYVAVFISNDAGYTNSCTIAQVKFYELV